MRQRSGSKRRTDLRAASIVVRRPRAGGIRESAFTQPGSR